MKPPREITIVLIAAPQKCAKCRQCEALLARLQERFPGQLSCRQLSALEEEARAFGVVLPPMLIVDDLIVSAGRVPDEEALVQLIEAKLSADQSAEAPGT